MTREVFISRYSPNRTNPENLEAITVQREELLSSAVESIRTSVLTDSKHHLLFIGPRGAGKTHSITLIHHRICKMEDLKPNLRIAWLNEDETSDTLLSLLLRIHRTLSIEHAEEFPSESLETILDLTDRDTATDAAADLLLQQLGNHTLLIMLENLDALFRDMTEIEQKRWRALVQNHPQFCTIATAQRLFSGVSSQEEPFFGFFQISHLHPFKVEDATDLLIKLARLKDDPDLANFINSSRGRARIRALHHLTGGNQRLFIILSDFINRDSLDSLVGPFEELVDEQLTPYYQERLRWLPTLQRKIVEFLCAAHKPMPVKEIARQLFATHPTIAGQLRDLRKIGYVTSNQRGRESLYELSEPLMRLSYQVKDAKGLTPLRLLVDFLRIWYDHDELTQRIKTTDPSATVTCNYLNAAISFNELEGNLRHQYLRADADGVDPMACTGDDLDTLRIIAEETNAPADLQRVGAALGSHGHAKEAIQVFSTIITLGTSSSEDVFTALSNRAIVHLQQQDTTNMIEDCSAMIHLKDAPTPYIAQAFINRGFAYGMLGKFVEECDDYTSVIELSDVPVAHYAMALVNRGITRDKIGLLDEAIADLSIAAELSGAPAKEVAIALINRGAIQCDRGNTLDAIVDYSSVIDMKGAPEEQIANAFYNRANAYFLQGRNTEAVADYTATVQFDGANDQTISWASYALVRDKISQGDWEKVFSLLRRVRISSDERLREWFNEDSTAFIQAIFESGQNVDAWRSRLDQLVEIYANNEVLVGLSKGLVNSISDLADCAISPEGLAAWCRLWEEHAKTYPELELGARLLKTGIAYLTSGKDITTLLELPEEERRILSQALGLEPTDDKE